MRLFSFFEKRNTAIVEKMCSAISNYMAQYAAEHSDDMEDTAYIFANALQMIKAARPRDVIKALRSEHISEEAAALNILQNCALTNIDHEALTDLIAHTDKDVAFSLYNAINEEKLRKDFISRHQYEEAKSLVSKIILGCSF